MSSAAPILEAWPRLHPYARTRLVDRALSREVHDQGWRRAAYLAMYATHTAT